MSYRQLTVAGLPALALFNEEIECVVVPSLGGKLTNLRRRRGREWLWRDRTREFTDILPDGRFPDTGGWDECFPTVAPCAMPGAGPNEPPLPDHGELWSLDWTHEVLETPVASVLASRVEGRLLPYEFQRDLIVPHEGAELRLEYRLIHRGEAPFPYLWAAHPLFSAPTGMTVTLPSVQTAKVDHAVARPDLPPNAEVPWPIDGGTPSWTMPEVQGWSAKLYAGIGASGMAILTDPTRGEQLELQVDPAQVPLIGLYVDATGEYPRLGLEPCHGAPDRLDRAVAEWRTAPVLEVGARRAWTITLRLPAFD